MKETCNEKDVDSCHIFATYTHHCSKNIGKKGHKLMKDANKPDMGAEDSIKGEDYLCDYSSEYDTAHDF